MFADDWIRTADLWYRKQLLYQIESQPLPSFILLLVNTSYLGIALQQTL